MNDTGPTAGGARYRRPNELAQALEALRGGGWSVLAGGTDFYPARVGRPVTEPVLDIGGLRALRGIRVEAGEGGPRLRVGALATWSELCRADLPAGCEALRMAAREVGGLQVQNQGTVGGNVCNASPAADGTAALMALDASVELLSAEGRRELALPEFVTGPRRTALRADELLSAVLVPLRPGAVRSVFLKLGHRRYLVISIAMVGAQIAVGADGRIGHAAVAVGACSAVATRLPALEARVRGLTPAQLVARGDSLVDADALAPLAPIADVRGSAEYRRLAAAQLVARALAELAVALPGAAGEMR